MFLILCFVITPDFIDQPTKDWQWDVWPIEVLNPTDDKVVIEGKHWRGVLLPQRSGVTYTGRKNAEVTFITLYNLENITITGIKVKKLELVNCSGIIVLDCDIQKIVVR